MIYKGDRVKKEFLKLLEDEEVQEAIKKIIFSHQENLKKENEKLKEENMKLIEKLKAFFSKEEAQKKELESLKEEIKKLKHENQKLKSKASLCDEELKVFREFEQYSKIESIKNIISPHFKEFIYKGAEHKNLMNLWDYIEIELRRGENDDIKRLIKVFDFFFEKIKLSYPYEEYEPLGEDYDPVFMINRSENSYGKVKEVILKGIKSKNGNIIKKAVVKVG
ncbi:MAG: nucleotide exchange factor GrpE [Epsilonproteobacteria bacterium]|nr:nucleotide exchange factor GrpE [Campylobacterota bacterium]